MFKILVTNEEVVRQRKLEKERFGEVQYIDLPAEESKEVEEEEIGEVEEESKNKTEEQKRKKEGRKVVKTIKFGVEILGGIAEVGQGIYLVIINFKHDRFFCTNFFLQIGRAAG